MLTATLFDFVANYYSVDWQARHDVRFFWRTRIDLLVLCRCTACHTAVDNVWRATFVQVGWTFCTVLS